MSKGDREARRIDCRVRPPRRGAAAARKAPVMHSARLVSAAGKTTKLTLGALVAATYFMVSGGPYGLEELVQKAGYSATLLILIATPIVWSLPTGLMVGELAAALPEEGGYYAWVKRALGPFWGFQEAWLSLAASVFDMAIYPTLFTLYLGKLVPSVA